MTHFSGACPVCNQITALSAESCTNCGNRNFKIDTGRRLRVFCWECQGLKSRCNKCSGSGFTYSNQQVDVRNPNEIRNAKQEAESIENDTQQRINEAKARKRQEEVKQARETEVRNYEYEQRKTAERQKAAKERIVLGFILAIISYPIVGLGGCIARVVITNPNEDNALSFPLYSWGCEACAVPMLIIVFTLIVAFRTGSKP
jgi:hypothetical protein